MQAPLRLNLCIKCADGQPRSLQQLWEELESDYKGENHFTLENLQRHVQALQAVGILKSFEIHSDNQSNHQNNMPYILTEYGYKKMQKALK